MARWEPGARNRLADAALELFLQHGFDRTTTSGIAVAAGVTERTFFRHFADKREVLFAGGERYQAAFTDEVAAAPAAASPLDLIAAALRGAAGFFPAERREHARRRQRVIDANPALRERELLKRAATAGAVATAMTARGVPEEQAVVAGESAAALFTVVYGRWIAAGEDRPMSDLVAEVLTCFRALAGG